MFIMVCLTPLDDFCTALHVQDTLIRVKRFPFFEYPLGFFWVIHMEVQLE